MSGYAVPAPPPVSTRPGVASEVEAEIQGQIAPLETEAGGFARAETRAMEDLNALFSGIMPFVAGSAQRVAEQYGATNAAQAQIFTQAWERLNSLRGQRASEAQALAQQIGAPIPLDGLMTQGITNEMGAFIPEAAGELLKASTIGQAGVQQAEAFAGRVMPLKQARMTREVKNYYRDQITDLRKQIASIKAMKPGMVNERLRARQLEDYEMRLARAESLFQREQTKRSLKLEEKRLAAQLEEIRGNQAIAIRDQNIGVQEAAKDRKLTKQQRQTGDRTYVNQQKQNIVQYVNALAGGGSNDVDRKVAEWVENPDTGQLEFKTYTRTETINTKGIRNPNQLLNQVLAQLGIKPGQKELYGFAVQQVVQTLRAAGLKGTPNDPKQWAKWWKTRQDRLKRAAAAAGMRPPYPPSAAGGPGN